MKKKLFIITLFCLFVIGLFEIIDLSENKLKSKCIFPSICIYNQELGSIASGVVVRSDSWNNFYYNVAVTCCHLLNEDDRLNPLGYKVKIPIFKNSKIEYYNEYKCIIYEKSEEYDLAIVIFLSNEKISCADMEFNPDINLNDKIMKIGYGLGDDLRIDNGNVTSISGKLNEHKNLLRMNAFAIFGDSGGPVFYKNKLIAITTGIRSVGPNCIFNISFASSINNLKAWNKEIDSIEFVYNKKIKTPILPIYMLEFEETIGEK